LITVEKNGVVRFEQKLKSRFLTRENLHYWGIIRLHKIKRFTEWIFRYRQKING